VVFSENFTWGVLVLNTNKAIYTAGDEVKFEFAVLDEFGNMVCDADLKLEIQNKEKNEKATLNTPDQIKVNSVCTQHNYTLIPDYEAKFKPAQTGSYDLTLTAETENGKYTISDTFTVQDKPDFEVERVSATRLYPLHEYPMDINIVANKKFKGQITEIVPESFEIGQKPDMRKFDDLVTKDGKRYLVWNIDLDAGEIIKLSYIFDPPDESPDLFRVGKLKFSREGDVIKDAMDIDEIVEETEESSESTESKDEAKVANTVETIEIVEFEETRYWLFANDAVTNANPERIYTTGYGNLSLLAGTAFAGIGTGTLLTLCLSLL
jgi:hypothetical protein